VGGKCVNSAAVVVGRRAGVHTRVDEVHDGRVVDGEDAVDERC
jgi:hypothetical protein